ncbi:hypothetical protein BDV93DRAFT_558612 [Ceratobasidium sp. AG-I]|nr:hypothetical protein BDV93DRAFT_558612 [Ceratobasidium sp. AG-I]
MLILSLLDLLVSHGTCQSHRLHKGWAIVHTHEHIEPKPSVEYHDAAKPPPMCVSPASVASDLRHQDLKALLWQSTTDKTTLKGRDDNFSLLTTHAKYS